MICVVNAENSFSLNANINSYGHCEIRNEIKYKNEEFTFISYLFCFCFWTIAVISAGTYKWMNATQHLRLGHLTKLMNAQENFPK